MRMGRSKEDWKIGLAWWIFIIILVYILFSLPLKAETDRIVVRPSVVSWNHEPYDITLTVITDEEGVAVGWGDGCKSLNEQVDGSITMVHTYRSCAETMRIVVAVGHIEGGKLKMRRYTKEFRVIGCGG